MNAGESAPEDLMKDANKTRDSGPRRGSPLWVYFVAVTGAGLAMLAVALLQLTAADIRVLTWQPVFWIVTGLIVFGELRPILTPASAEDEGVTTSTTFTFALLLYVGLPVAALLQAFATLVTGVLTRKAPFRTAFNVAQYTLSLAAATLVLSLLGVTPSPTQPWVIDGQFLLGVAAAAAAYFVVNDALVGIAVALHERQPVLTMLRSDLAYQVLVNLALLGLSPLVVVVMHRSAALVPLFVLPLIAVYMNASVSVSREHQAHHDGLTGLPNRKLLFRHTEAAFADARRAGARVGLALLDLDRFKEVNDTLGHPTGDRLLQLVSHRLRHSVRPCDVVARLGGDEFAVLLPGVRDAASAREVAARIRAALAEPVRLDGMLFDLEASVGIALYPEHAPDFEQLFQRADVAMYLAKEERNGVEIYAADKDRNSPGRLSLLGDLRRAIDQEELELHYQPKVSLSDGGLIGVEGLVRWRHPERGLILPSEFVPLAEQSYLMRGLTQRVIETALSQAARWWSQGLTVPVAVNVSARDLLDSSLTDLIVEGLLRHDVPPHALHMEITERVFMTEPAHAADTIGALAQVGIPLSLDDFGTGYSSLVRLKRMPVEEIKIDGSFVQRLTDGGDDVVIVRSIVDLARALELRSVAEGVEDAETMQMLHEMGCDAAQGWHVSRPMDADEATVWLTERASRVRLAVTGPDAG